MTSATIKTYSERAAANTKARELNTLALLHASNDELIAALRDIMGSCRKYAGFIDRSRGRTAIANANRIRKLVNS